MSYSIRKVYGVLFPTLELEHRHMGITWNSLLKLFVSGVVVLFLSSMVEFKGLKPMHAHPVIKLVTRVPWKSLKVTFLSLK